MSTATVYRHFARVEQVSDAYLLRVVEQLAVFSHDCPADGAELFGLVAGRWGALVEQNGAAMVQLRSRRGLLARLAEGDPVITTVRVAWERPLRALMASDGIPATQFLTALQLCNALLDPREILDRAGGDLTVSQATRQLAEALRGALRTLATPT